MIMDWTYDHPYLFIYGLSFIFSLMMYCFRWRNSIKDMSDTKKEFTIISLIYFAVFPLLLGLFFYVAAEFNIIAAIIFVLAPIALLGMLL